MLNLIAVVSYLVVLGVSVWVASEYELGLAKIRHSRRLAQ